MFKDKNIKILDNILIKVLFEGKVSYTELKDTFFIKEELIENYIEIIRTFIFDYYLSLEWAKDENKDKNNKDKKMLVLVGEEAYIRKLQLRVIRESENNEVVGECVRNLKKSFDSIKIKEFLDKVQNKIGNPMSDESKSVITNYINLASERIKKNNILEKVPNCHFLEETDEYQIISEYKNILEKKLGITLCREETLKITECILGSHSYNFKTSYYKNWIEIEKLVKSLIEKFDKTIDEDIKDDDKLFKGLLNHMKPAIYRAKSKILLENSVYDEVMEIYPEIFYKVVKVLGEFEEFLGEKINKEEIAFLVVHFKSAMDRENRRKR